MSSVRSHEVSESSTWETISRKASTVGTPSNPVPLEEQVRNDERQFRLECKIPGNDSLYAPQCFLNTSLCHRCVLFIITSLTKQTLGKQDRQSTWLRIDSFVSRAVFHHYSSVRLLKHSARAGCEFCSKVVECIQVDDDDRIVFTLSGRPWKSDAKHRFGEKERDWFTFAVTSWRALSSKYPKEKDLIFEFMLAIDEADCLNMPYIGLWDSSDTAELPWDADDPEKLPWGVYETDLRRFPALDASSETSINQIRKWNDSCASQHLKCPRQDLPLPTRLLDLYPTDSTSGTSVALVESKSFPPNSGKIRYIALSYCWGDWSGEKTTKENLPAMMQGIPPDNFPATISDAIQVCRKYGMRYLWVDAFCICQDDNEEWEIEAANMSNVYGGCEFVLSILTSPEASNGFLKDRHFEPIVVGNFKELSYGSWVDSPKLFIRRRPRALEDEFERAPLNQRAWPLQEKILAPAVVHFGRDQLIWECNEDHLLSETGEISVEPALVIRVSDGLRAGQSSDFQKSLWNCIVEEYTQRSLSKYRDRIPALSGMQKRFLDDKVYTGSYRAGLWEFNLEHQLLWRTADITRTLEFVPSQPDFKMPSWSWARHNAAVNMLRSEQHFSALESPAKFVVDNKTLEASSGVPDKKWDIQLTGFMQKVSEKALSIDCQPYKQRNGDTLFFGLPGEHSKWWFDQESLNTDQYYCLRMLENDVRDSESQPWFPSEIYYLLLRKVARPGGTGKDFARVGVLMLHAVTEDYFSRPYTDLFCKNGKPLLTDGEWMQINLI